MKLPTAWQYRYVFFSATFLTVGLIGYGMISNMPIYVAVAFVLWIVNMALIIHLPD